MKLRTAPRAALAVLLPALLSFSQLGAQGGVASTSASRTSYLASLGIIPQPGEYEVEQLINYHRHRIPLPKAGRAVALDVRWGNDRVSLDRPRSILQIGLATAMLHDMRHVPPINLCLVIDSSGSMSASDKMSRVKESMRRMIEHLRPSDFVSIVTFRDTAEVVCPARRLGGRRRVRAAVEEILPGGSTNLHAGLMLGLKEVQKNFHLGMTNRVILLTDGIANTGIVDPERILRDALVYKDRGTDLSTIGVGQELNRELLKRLARGGRGVDHFVASAEDIKKVFEDELQSLVSPVARNVRMSVEWDPNLELVRTFGYEPKYGPGRLHLHLDDLNHGATQLVMLAFKAQKRGLDRRRLPVRVKLTYYDPRRRGPITVREEVELTVEGSKVPMLVDSIVRKNYVIARIALTMKDATEAWHASQRRQALSMAAKTLERARGIYPKTRDKDIRRNLDRLKALHDTMRRILERDC